MLHMLHNSRKETFNLLLGLFCIPEVHPYTEMLADKEKDRHIFREMMVYIIIRL